MRSKYLAWGIVALLLIVILALPSTRRIFIKYDYTIQKVDEENYKNKKMVEDTARSMVAQYESDKLTYESYKDSEKESQQELATNAKIRANNTATKYNTFILENSYVWRDNIPKDILHELQIIE